MKNLLIFFILISLNNIQSQQLNVIELLPPSSSEHSDLTFFNDTLKEKKLVMLGEMTHMYGNIFEMKSRVVEFLHEELGFNTIAMESSMYDLWKMNQNKEFNSEKFNDAIFGVWSNSLEFQRLVNYIKTNNLKVIGFDSQINNSSQFINDFFDYFEDQNIDLNLDEDDMAIIMEGILNDFQFEEYDIKFKDFENELERLTEKIKKLKSNEENYSWEQFVKSLLASAKDSYYNKDAILSTYFGNKQHNIRDKQMADNLLSYIVRNPNEKIVCWADNIHIINDISSINKPIISEFIPMGSYIKKALGDDVYSLATIHSNDSLLEKKTWHKTPLKTPSFESELKSLKMPYAFISSYQDEMKKIKQHRLLNYTDFIDGRLDQLFDGYIYINNATLSKPNVTEKDIVKEFDESKPAVNIDTIKAVIDTKNNVSIIKGQIVDSETNNPVSYANLILKKEAIYRIADAEGYFEISIDNSLLSEASVNISSMGYTSVNVPLNSLQATTLLKPSLELLNEVIITAHRSPLSVLKEAIKKIEVNHPTSPFNYERYTNVLMNRNDQNLINIDLITKEYDQGYRQQNRLTQRVKQIKWNTNLLGDKLNNTAQIFNYRQNALRYSNIVHKRKYKKFTLNFIKSKDPVDEGLYIIEFKTERMNWNYTNRSYPTSYNGKIYINRKNLAIVKVIENWTTTLIGNDIEEYGEYLGIIDFRNKKEINIKEENTCIYSINEDNKYYASKYFRREFKESIDNNDTYENVVFEFNSALYEVQTKNIEIIDYDYYKKNETVLRRVKYDPDFWNFFDINSLENK